MILQKNICKTTDGYRVVLYDYKTKKSKCVTGNIPELPKGSNINVNIVGDKIISYTYSFTPRNKKILENNGIDINEFREKISKHTKDILWKDIVSDPYKIYIFSKADIIGKKLGFSIRHKSRVELITKECIENFRNKRQTEYTLSDYIDEFRRVEQRGVFDLMPFLDVVSTIKDERLSLSSDNGIKINDKQLKIARNYVDNDIDFRNCEIREFISETDIENYLKNTKLNLTNEQKDAVRSLCDNRPVVITGGAGTGKTTTIKALVECFSSKLSKDFILLAPTGKASRRLNEVSEIKGKSFTIHSALRKGDDFVFYNMYNKMKYSLYIVDESSMIDTMLMKDLLCAIDKNAKVIFVGDSNQLYPVGCGEPFFDFIKICKTIYLTKNFRQESGSIIDNAMHILDDGKITPSKDFKVYKIKKEAIFNFVKKDLSIQNISPFNDLNDEINKSVLREKFKSDDTERFFVGEKVILLKNKKSEEGSYSNGDIGEISHLNEDGSVCIRLEDLENNEVLVKRKDIGDIAPAYAITIHKMQGSECDEINIFIPQKKTGFVTKRMLYTAVTRAKKKVNLYLYE